MKTSSMKEQITEIRNERGLRIALGDYVKTDQAWETLPERSDPSKTHSRLVACNEGSVTSFRLMSGRLQVNFQNPKDSTGDATYASDIYEVSQLGPAEHK